MVMMSPLVPPELEPAIALLPPGELPALLVVPALFCPPCATPPVPALFEPPAPFELPDEPASDPLPERPSLPPHALQTSATTDAPRTPSALMLSAISHALVTTPPR